MPGQDDARTLAPAAQAHLRRLAVKAVRTGCKQTEAAKTYGVSLRAVNTWVAIDKVGGLRALKPKRRGRRRGQGGRLSVTQAQHIRRLIVGKLPDQLKLPFYLWTRAAVASLIARNTGSRSRLSPWGATLRRGDLTPRSPGRPAFQRNRAALRPVAENRIPKAGPAGQTKNPPFFFGGKEMGAPQ